MSTTAFYSCPLRVEARFRGRHIQDEVSEAFEVALTHSRVHLERIFETRWKKKVRKQKKSFYIFLFSHFHSFILELFCHFEAMIKRACKSWDMRRVFSQGLAWMRGHESGPLLLVDWIHSESIDFDNDVLYILDLELHWLHLMEQPFFHFSLWLLLDEKLLVLESFFVCRRLNPARSRLESSGLLWMSRIFHVLYLVVDKILILS